MTLDRGDGISFCETPARGVRWLTAGGELLPVRCGRTNSCRYCARLKAAEDVVVLKLDALEGSERPTWGVTLTTTPTMGGDLRKLLRASQSLWRALRRDYGFPVEYCGMVEWTRGEGRTSMRLPHVHYLVKGAGDAGIPHAVLSSKWRSITRSAWVVESRPLRTWAGAVAYLFAAHHSKAIQAPPAGVRSTKRFRPSRGFFDKPLPVMRAQARELLRDRRVAGLALDLVDAPSVLDEQTAADLIDANIAEARELYQERRPRLIKVDERTVAQLVYADLRESRRRARAG